MTTSIQSLTIESIERTSATLQCHFLPGTNADGCLVQWEQIGGQQSGNNVMGDILTHRTGLANIVNVQIGSLQPETQYVVKAYSMKGRKRLHSFGIPLNGGLVTMALLPTTNGNVYKN